MLLASTTDRADRTKLQQALEHLDQSLAAGLWTDASHLNLQQGQQVFQEEKNTVVKLQELLQDNRSTVDKGQFQAFINQLVAIDRQLAVVAIQAPTDARKIAKAQDELTQGDAEAAASRPANAIEHYRLAWIQATMK